MKNYLGRIFQILVKTLLPLKVLGVRPITAANTHELEILSSTGGKAMLAHFFCHIFCRVCHQVSDGMLAWKRENFFVSVLTVYGHIFEMAGPKMCLKSPGTAVGAVGFERVSQDL